MRSRRVTTALVVVSWLTLLAPKGAAQPAPSGTPKAEPAPQPAVPSAESKPAPKAAEASRTKPARTDAKDPKSKPTAKKTTKDAPKAASKPKKGQKKLARKPGSEAGKPDEATRRIIAGPPRPSDKSAGRAESPELRQMRELDLALFPSHRPDAGAPWPSDTVAIDPSGPKLLSTGLPPPAEIAAPSILGPAPGDMSWLKSLAMPDIPVRWDARVVRYLEFYKNNPRGRSMVASWLRKSGRYGAEIRRVLADHGLPQDILWLALVESGFDPTIVSPAGAAGLWQFMPEGARIYGLTVDRWIDERLDPERSTVAAARYLTDLHTRFGGWELAFAAYNMGYGGLLAAIRKYNTNDYWELARFEAGIPFETALYVPKIVAMAIVAKNRAMFGLEDVELDPPVAFDKVAVGSGVSVRAIAAASGADASEIARLNPQILATRTPPVMPGDKQSAWIVRVPPGAGARAAKTIEKLAAEEPKLERYLVRWGESLEDIAAIRKTTKSTIASLNGLRKDEVVRPGTVLFVPASPGVGVAAAAEPSVEVARPKPIVVVPPQAFSFPDRRRVFYRVIHGDTLHDVARVFSVTPDELSRWNLLDPGAALQEGMTLQLFLPARQKVPEALLLEEKDARVLVAGSQEFFAHFEGLKGRMRLEITAREGDTWKALAKRYGLSVGMLERINQRSRSSAILPGERLVVYVPKATGAEPAEPPAPPGERAPADASDVVVAGATPTGEGKDEDSVKPAVLPVPED